MAIAAEWAAHPASSAWQSLLVLTDQEFLLRLSAAGALTWAMSLFPDLDTHSIPRKHFFRLMFIIFLLLSLAGKTALVAPLALLSLLPLLGKHRGWTHHPLTPVIIAAIVAIFTAYFDVQTDRTPAITAAALLRAAVDNWHFLLAIIAGHYTHLLLDSAIWKRLITIPRNRSRINRH